MYAWVKKVNSYQRMHIIILMTGSCMVVGDQSPSNSMSVIFIIGQRVLIVLVNMHFNHASHALISMLEISKKSKL